MLVKHKEDKAAEITKKSLTVKEIKNLPADFEEVIYAYLFIVTNLQNTYLITTNLFFLGKRFL